MYRRRRVCIDMEFPAFLERWTGQLRLPLGKLPNAALDMDILTGSTLLAIQKMTFNGNMGFQSKPSKPIDIQLLDKQFHHLFMEQAFGPLDAHQGIMGVQDYERGLMFAEICICFEWAYEAAVPAEERVQTSAVGAWEDRGGVGGF